MEKTILVTGGAGFIGSNLVHHLYQRYPRYRLLVLDALTYAGHVDNLPEGGGTSDRCEFWHGDVGDGQLVDSLVRRSDVVIHAAAESSVTRSIQDCRLFFETDVLGTQTVVSAVARFRDQVQLFVHISSSEVYGTAQKPSMGEDHPLVPMSPYAAAKCGADRLVHAYISTYRIPAVIVRPFNNYGPRQHLEKVVPRFITSCFLDESLMVHGDGSAERDFLFVEDHVHALDLLIHAERTAVVGQTINLGTGRSIPILQLAEMIRDLMGARARAITFLGDRPGQVVRHACDAALARRLLGWAPRVGLQEGVERTVRWYRDNRAWWHRQIGMRHVPIVTASGRKEMH